MRHLLAALLLAALPTAGAAHGLGGELPPDGIRIASLGHGQMTVIARHRAAILDLAARHYPPDDRLRRLTNYAEIQFAYCLWGRMPGTVTDELSPFNVCAHAYLAATRDALVRLTELAGDDPQVAALVRRVEGEMMANGSGLVLCQYSGDQFSTAVMVPPDWRALPGHGPSLALAAAVVAAAGLGLGGLVRGGRSRRT